MTKALTWVESDDFPRGSFITDNHKLWLIGYGQADRLVASGHIYCCDDCTIEDDPKTFYHLTDDCIIPDRADIDIYIARLLAETPDA